MVHRPSLCRKIKVVYVNLRNVAFAAFDFYPSTTLSTTFHSYFPLWDS